MDQDSATATQIAVDDASPFFSSVLTPASQRILVPELIGGFLDALMHQMGFNENVKLIDRELLKIAQCSRLFQEEAERRLYTSINFTVGTTRARDLATVMRARTAKYIVRYLKIFNYGAARGRGDTSIFSVAGIPFSLMTGLDGIEVHFAHARKGDDIAPYDDRLFQILDRDLQDNILKGFRCAHPLSRSCVPFLSRQRTLEVLQINLISIEPVPTEDVVNRATFPKLTTIIGSIIDSPSLSSIIERSAIQYFTPLHTFGLSPGWSSYSHQLITLDVAHCQALDPSTVEEVARCSPRLQLFMVKLDHQWEEKKINIFDRLTQLAHLEVVGILPEPSTFNDYFISTVGHIRACKGLRSLVIVVSTGETNQFCGIEMQRTVRKAWTQTTPGVIDIIGWKAKHVERIELSRKKT
ncbi:hypothetical protein SISNIDRAFT_450548, partial [Sistotremastrum niveocremeum HHB9708]